MTDRRSRLRTRLRFSLSASLATIVTVSLVMARGADASISHDSPMDASGSFNDIHFQSGGNAFSPVQAAAAQNQSLLWGVYRPNLYFGTRPRLPNSVLTGLMWFGTQDYSGIDSMLAG